jgi:hypothetical protein
MSSDFSSTVVSSTTENNGQTQGTMDRADKILPIITILVILVIGAVFILLSWSDLFPPTPQNFCGPGLCANDIYSGQKTCPSSAADVVPLDPTFETCNPPTGCTSDQAPCLYYDPTIGTVCPGQQNFMSSCPSGVSAQNCGCSSRIYCPNFATVYFVEKVVNSPDTTQLCTNFVSLVQETVWTDATGLPRNDLPISPGPSTAQNFFCGVQGTQLNSIWPPNECLSGELIFNTVDNLYYCANVPQGLSCPSGELPFRQSNGEFICQADSNSIQFS